MAPTGEETVMCNERSNWPSWLPVHERKTTTTQRQAKYSPKGLLTTAFVLVNCCAATLANPIDLRLDIDGTRSQLGSTQGLLSYRHAGPTFNGEERSGWIDVRHPG